jgi:hypothetical protein
LPLKLASYGCKISFVIDRLERGLARCQAKHV